MFARNLRRALTAAGLTERQVAEATGISLSTIYNWERGRYGPRGMELVMVARILGTTAEKLMEGERWERKEPY